MASRPSQAASMVVCKDVLDMAQGSGLGVAPVSIAATIGELFIETTHPALRMGRSRPRFAALGSRGWLVHVSAGDWFCLRGPHPDRLGRRSLAGSECGRLPHHLRPRWRAQPLRRLPLQAPAGRHVPPPAAPPEPRGARQSAHQGPGRSALRPRSASALLRRAQPTSPIWRRRWREPSRDSTSTSGPRHCPARSRRAPPTA